MPFWPYLPIPGAARHPDCAGAGAAPLDDRAPRRRAQHWQEADSHAQGPDPEAAVQGGAAGRHRAEDRRVVGNLRDAQGRARKVLRRRHLAQEEAAAEAEGDVDAPEAGGCR